MIRLLIQARSDNIWLIGVWSVLSLASSRNIELVGYGEKTMANPIIRRVGSHEIAAVLAMWRAAGVTPPSVGDSIEGLTRLIREPAALLLVAAINDQIVGSVIGTWDGWRGNIYRLAVTPEHRRKGIARRLIAEITAELFAKGATRLSALVEHEHQWAMDFWDSVIDLGFERDPKFARYIADRRGGWGSDRRK